MLTCDGVVVVIAVVVRWVSGSGTTAGATGVFIYEGKLRTDAGLVKVRVRSEGGLDGRSAKARSGR